MINVKYFWGKCDKQYSKLMNPNDEITWEVCGQRYCQKLENMKKKRVIKKENIRRERQKENDGTYRIIFPRNSRSHNRTDINDRNLNNVYGDARDTQMRNQEEEKKVPNSRRNINNIRRPNVSNTNPFQRNAENTYQFQNSGIRRPQRPTRESRGSNRNRPRASRGQTADSRPQGKSKYLCIYILFKAIKSYNHQL